MADRPSSDAGRSRVRDRHGRGFRGPIAAQSLPMQRTRAQRFDDLVLDAVEQLEPRWSKELAGVEFGVEDVPFVTGAAGEPRLGRAVPARGTYPARVIVYRRPIEARTDVAEDLAVHVLDVVVEMVAELLGKDPEDIDPGFDSD
jgi:predicted Zn-dependent protease with MMP-like domain